MDTGLFSYADPDFNLTRTRLPVTALNLGEMTKRRRGKIVCGLCKEWHAGKVTTIKVGEKEVAQRHCSINGKHKQEYDGACDEFILARYFYCKAQGCWVSPVACVNRQENRVAGCSKSCSGYGRVVSFLITK